MLSTLGKAGDDAHASADAFRSVMGSYATGVTVVATTGARGEPVGLTINSFSSLSLQPPLVLWSLGLNSQSLPAFLRAEHFSVNVLACDQQELARRFARRGLARWEGVSWRLGHAGLPLIQNALACLQCRRVDHSRHGDHELFIGRVLSCTHDKRGQPLLFHGGRYHHGLTMGDGHDSN